MQNILLWVWCFPQMLAGAVLARATHAERHGDHYRYKSRRGSVSLGEYVFLCPAHWDDEQALKHEQGHTKQSRILGWLYLPLVGLPSIIWAGCFRGFRNKHHVSYYSVYPENWADRLGGVER